MLNLLDESLQTFLRAAVPLPESTIDVSFDAPDREWGARISRPTVNLYLWDVRPNLRQREAGVELVPDGDNRGRLRKPFPRVDCRYLVTAWTAEVRDEHLLLGATLAALLRTEELDKQHLHEAIRAVRPLPTLEVSADGGQSSDFWSALGNQLKPGLDLTVTVTVETAVSVPVGADVERFLVRSSTMDRAPVSDRQFYGVRTGAPAGSAATSPRGAGRVDADGRAVVPAADGDAITLDGETWTVPAVDRTDPLSRS